MRKVTRMKHKTIHDAVKMLPPQYRKPILDLWDLTGCTDIYDGELGQYLNVIISHYHHCKDQLELCRDQISDIKIGLKKIIDSPDYK